MATQILFLACGLLFLGITLATIGGISLRPALNSLRWPATLGEVLTSKVVARDGRNLPIIRYRYLVKGEPFTAARISFRSTSSLPGFTTDPSRIVARYPEGSSITVYYDPSDPGRAVLEPGANLSAYLPLAAGALFFLLGLLSLPFAFL